VIVVTTRKREAKSSALIPAASKLTLMVIVSSGSKDIGGLNSFTNPVVPAVSPKNLAFFFKILYDCLPTRD